MSVWSYLPPLCHVDLERVGPFAGVLASVDQAEAWRVIPYQRKYSHPYHTCPLLSLAIIYLLHMSWIPDLITRLPPVPFFILL